MQSVYTKTMMCNLEKYRVKHGYTQTEFATMLNTSKSNYTKMLNGGINKISADAIKDIYDATGMLCFELMEVCSDDFLRLVTLLHSFTPDEQRFMLQFVEVYLESKRRIDYDNR